MTALRCARVNDAAYDELIPNCHPGQQFAHPTAACLCTTCPHWHNADAGYLGAAAAAAASVG